MKPVNMTAMLFSTAPNQVKLLYVPINPMNEIFIFTAEATTEAAIVTTGAPATTAAATTLGWAGWSDWGSCTLTCGSGIRTRTRTYGSLGNDENQIAACNTDACRE